MDKVSIITVCYNAASTIRRTIESILEQSYTNYEYLVIDGVSQDETLNIVKSYINVFRAKNISLLLISEKDKGIYDAMNKAIDLATGDWINFMNADDSFYNSKSLKSVFDQHLEGCDVVYGNCVRLDGQDEYPMKANPPETLPKQMPFMHQAVFVRSKLCRKYKFDLNYKLCADYDSFFKIYADGYRFKQLNTTICNYSIRGISGKALLEAQKEVIQIKEKHSEQFQISMLDRIQWKWEALGMWIKMMMPEQILKKLRQLKHL